MQIVGYETAVGGERDQPALLLAGDGEIDREPLASGRQFGYSLGNRHCAGTIDETGHTSCPAEDPPYCPTHTKRWACARCRGDCDRPLSSCHEEHAVYLAAFAPATFKIGVTRSWRLDTRLREQGADRAAHLRTVADGKIARQIEAEIAADVGDQVRVPAKIRGLHREVSTAAWEQLLSEYDVLSTYAFDYGLSLQERPVAETVLTGSVRGTQGRVLVLERRGTVYAVDMRDLVGHELTDGGTDRALQSSLASFE